MIKKLQLVALGWVVFQGTGLVAMDNNALKKALTCSQEARKEVEIRVALQRLQQEKKHFPSSVPYYVVAEKRDWSAELEKNPHLAWMPI
jgi:hypothetical protein